jgi:hypothetical protein
MADINGVLVSSKRAQPFRHGSMELPDSSQEAEFEDHNYHRIQIYLE